MLELTKISDFKLACKETGEPITTLSDIRKVVVKERLGSGVVTYTTVKTNKKAKNEESVIIDKISSVKAFNTTTGEKVFS